MTSKVEYTIETKIESESHVKQETNKTSSFGFERPLSPLPMFGGSKLSPCSAKPVSTASLFKSPPIIKVQVPCQSLQATMPEQSIQQNANQNDIIETRFDITCTNTNETNDSSSNIIRRSGSVISITHSIEDTDIPTTVTTSLINQEEEEQTHEVVEVKPFIIYTQSNHNEPAEQQANFIKSEPPKSSIVTCKADTSNLQHPFKQSQVVNVKYIDKNGYETYLNNANAKFLSKSFGDLTNVFNENKSENCSKVNIDESTYQKLRQHQQPSNYHQQNQNHHHNHRQQHHQEQTYLHHHCQCHSKSTSQSSSNHLSKKTSKSFANLDEIIRKDLEKFHQLNEFNDSQIKNIKVKVKTATLQPSEPIRVISACSNGVDVHREEKAMDNKVTYVIDAKTSDNSRHITYIKESTNKNDANISLAGCLVKASSLMPVCRSLESGAIFNGDTYGLLTQHLQIRDSFYTSFQYRTTQSDGILMLIVDSGSENAFFIELCDSQLRATLYIDGEPDSCWTDMNSLTNDCWVNVKFQLMGNKLTLTVRNDYYTKFHRRSLKIPIRGDLFVAGHPCAIEPPRVCRSKDFFVGEMKDFYVNHNGIKWYGVPSILSPRLRAWY